MKDEHDRPADREKRTLILLLSVILLLAAVSCVLGVRLYSREQASPVGNWQMRLDMTELVRMQADAWLHEAELGSQVDVGNRLPQIQIAVSLKLDPDGNWSRQVDAGSYEAAQKSARQALASSLRELVILRAAAAGRSVRNPKQAEALIADVIGMSGEQYLADYGPKLLPALEELQARYDGSGTWQITGQNLCLEGSPKAHFLVDEQLLVLSWSEGTEVYRRAKN